MRKEQRKYLTNKGWKFSKINGISKQRTQNSENAKQDKHYNPIPRHIMMNCRQPKTKG